ncbi:MAG: Na(+)/H(+) antiporter subunit C [Frankiales bacterium]|nr:Na(+)/H(+) antiporter subunit C [Frankiales bacterium]
MTGNLTLALLTGLLYTVGTYLLLQRTLTRVVIGLGLLGHGANLLLLQAGGAVGAAPFAGSSGAGLAGQGTADPLPQAMVLTAIVITFGVSAFLLALAYRSWVVTGGDEVQDDVEDARIARARPEAHPHPHREEDDL